MRTLCLILCFCWIGLIEAARPRVIAIFGKETCPWSKEFRQEVWENEIFQTILKAMEVEVEEMEAPKGEIETPIMVLLSEKGEEIGRVGYFPLSPEKYGALFQEMIAVDARVGEFETKTVPQLLSLYRKCQVLNMHKCEAQILEVGLSKDSGTDFLLEKYALMINSHPRKAHKIKEEIRSRAPQSAPVEWQLALLAFEAKKEKNLPIKNTIRPIEKYLERFKDQTWRCHLILSEFFKEKKMDELSQYHAKVCRLEAPTDMKELLDGLAHD